eukprot:Nk52_evm18s239 gene=Nk52_evmTU18s239
MESFQRLLGNPTGNDEESQQLVDTFMGEMDSTCALSRKTRIYGFGLCFAAGWIMSICSCISLALGRVSHFAVLYSAGNIVSILSSGFLVGPVRHMKTMFAPVRAMTTCIMLVFIFLTLYSGLYLHKTGLTVLCVMGEFCAMLWYYLSYIPYGRTLMSKCLGSCMPSDTAI